MPEDNSPMGWAQFFKTLADRYGLPAVALTIITGAVFWHGNEYLESMRIEQAEDKKYFRQEFKVIVENNTKALLESQAMRSEIVSSLEENTDELKALRAEIRGHALEGLP